MRKTPVSGFPRALLSLSHARKRRALASRSKHCYEAIYVGAGPTRSFFPYPGRRRRRSNIDFYAVQYLKIHDVINSAKRLSAKKMKKKKKQTLLGMVFSGSKRNWRHALQSVLVKQICNIRALVSVFRWNQCLYCLCIEVLKVNRSSVWKLRLSLHCWS